MAPTLVLKYFDVSGKRARSYDRDLDPDQHTLREI